MGVCGEHGGDPYSIHFFDSVGMDYVSCSPLPRAHRPIGGGTGPVRATLS
ncbi:MULTISPECIES: putative PEP-binding protein [Streptomyces]